MIEATDITIRDTMPGDIAEMARLGAQFHVEAGWNDITDYNVDHCAESLTALLRAENVVMLVAERQGRIVGMACGASLPLYFNHSHWHGQELFFWVDPEFRGQCGARLMDAFEMAMQNIAASMAMVALANVRPEVTGRFYARRGFRASENTWIKRF